ncbi:MAG: diguanylate cyclase [Pseudomonadota bacterium]|nr:diguanylate cyclase [Pseudomonadota bacterium]
MTTREPSPEAAREAALQSLGLDGQDSEAIIDALLARLALAQALATFDPLTGTWQRGAILGQLDQAHARAMRDGRPLGVMQLAVRYFGDHQTPEDDPIGTQVLQAVSARLRDTLRGGDAIGRVAGNRFLCLLEACDITAASMVAERCRRAITDLPVSLNEGSLTLVRAEAGLVMVHPNAEIGADIILEQADLLLAQSAAHDGHPVAVKVLAPD